MSTAFITSAESNAGMEWKRCKYTGFEGVVECLDASCGVLRESACRSVKYVAIGELCGIVRAA